MKEKTGYIDLKKKSASKMGLLGNNRGIAIWDKQRYSKL